MFELTNGHSISMIGKATRQDATINPNAKEELSYAVVEDIGSIEFQIRIESTQKGLQKFLIQPTGIVLIKL